MCGVWCGMGERRVREWSGVVSPERRWLDLTFLILPLLLLLLECTQHKHKSPIRNTPQTFVSGLPVAGQGSEGRRRLVCVVLLGLVCVVVLVGTYQLTFSSVQLSKQVQLSSTERFN